MRAGILIGMAVALSAQTKPDPTDVLMRARDQMVDRTNRAPNYTCVLTINRKYFKRSAPGVQPSCGWTLKCPAESRSVHGPARTSLTRAASWTSPAEVS